MYAAKRSPCGFLPDTDTEDFDKVGFSRKHLQDAALEQGMHSFIGGAFPYGGDGFPANDHLLD
jgi:hypothetical protein